MKRIAGILLLAGLALTACSGGGDTAELNQQGNDAFAAQDYVAATEHYTQAQSADPTNAQVAYNLANTHYRQEAFDQVPAAMMAALPQADTALAAQANYNMGNALYNGEQYEEAVAAYKDALRLDPADADAKHNLELALRQLKQEEEQQKQNQEQQNQEQQNQEQQNQEQQNQGQQSQDQQNQDQQNQDQQNQEQQNQDQQNQDQQNQNQQNQDQQNQGQQNQGQKQSDKQNQEQKQPDEQKQQDQGNQKQDQQAQPGAGSKPATEAEGEPGASQAVQMQGLTKEQARQMLIAAAQGTQTLQEYLQQMYAFPIGAVEKDW